MVAAALYSIVLAISGMAFLIASQTEDGPLVPIGLAAIVMMAVLGLHFSIWAYHQEARRRGAEPPRRIPRNLSSMEARLVILRYQQAIERAEKEAAEYRATVGWLNSWIEAKEKRPGEIPVNVPCPPCKTPRGAPPPPRRGAGELR